MAFSAAAFSAAAFSAAALPSTNTQPAMTTKQQPKNVKQEKKS